MTLSATVVQYGTMRHILSVCSVGLKERHTWRHNQTLKVLFDLLRKKIDDFGEGNIPSDEESR